MINTSELSPALNEDKLQRELQEMSLTDDSVYSLNSFDEYPEQMSMEDRLVLQVVLAMHPDKSDKVQKMIALLQADIEQNED